MTENCKCRRKTTLQALRKRGTDRDAITEVMQSVACDNREGNGPNRAQVVTVSMMVAMRFFSVREGTREMAVMVMSMAMMMMTVFNLSVLIHYLQYIKYVDYLVTVVASYN